MKRFKPKLFVLLAGVLLTLCFSVSAQSIPTVTIDKPIKDMTIPELQTKIAEIMTVIQQLQALITQLTGSTDISSIPSSYTFNTSLSYGTSSMEVKYVQIFLNQDPDTRVSSTGPGSPGQETTYFGTKTKQAVIKFQLKYKNNISAAAGYAISCTGYVGKGTRQQMNQVLNTYRGGQAPSPSPTPPSSGTYCGDNIAQRPSDQGIIEDCDGLDLRTKTCVTQGYTGGTLSCNTDCSFNTSQCTGTGPGGTTTPPSGGAIAPQPTGPVCGDNTDNVCPSGCTHSQDDNCTYCGDSIIQSPNNEGISEVCDTLKLNNQTCITKGYTGGTLQCSSNCLTFNTAQCTPPSPPNQAPILNTIGNKSINENQELSFTITATDADNDPLSYSVQPLPTGSSFNTTNRTLAWTPTYAQSGTYTLTFTVSDGALTDTETITITVQEVCNITTCQALNHECGTYNDNCGGTLNCGTCQSGYACTNGQCVEDAPVSVCGDGTCNGTETCSTCPGDCGVCPTGGVYYLDAVNGNDNNAGTSAFPWQTLNRAYTWYNGTGVKVQEGDTVLFRNGNYGSFLDTSRIPTDNEPFYRTDWITYKADAGHTPVLTDVEIYNADLWGATRINGDSYVILDGFNILDGVKIEQTSYVQIRNCDITVEPLPYSGLYAPYRIKDGLVGADVNYITIENNDIHHANYAINVEKQIDGGSYWTIRGNRLHQLSNDGIEASGPSHMIIENNYIYDQVKWRTHMAVMGTKSGEFIEGENVILQGTGARGIVYKIDPPGSSVLAILQTNDVLFKDEWVKDKSVILVGETSGATISNIIEIDPVHVDSLQFQVGMIVSDIVIRNNTLIREYGHQGIKFGASGEGAINDVIFENNLVWAPKPIIAGGSINVISFNNNTFYSLDIGGVSEGNGIVTDALNIANMYNNIFGCDSYLTAVQNHGNNIYRYEPTGFGIDPSELVHYDVEDLFVGPANGDFHLENSSQAIDFGNSAYAPITDIEDNSRKRAPDAGAYEYQGAAPQCSGTDTSCGPWLSCQNCNSSDSCVGDGYRDYYCSGTSCIYAEDNCSDCSCVCGNYNADESTVINCSDSKDNDCDGLIDSNDPGCETPTSADYISYYKFEGNANDQTGNNHGTIYGDPQFVSGVQGQGVEFDGYGDYVDCGEFDDVEGLSAVSFSMWVKTATTPPSTTRRPFDKDDVLRLSHFTGEDIGFSVHDSGGYAAGIFTDGITDTDWHHIAGTFDGQYVTVYIDNVAGGTVGDFGSPTTVRTSTANLLIGGGPGNNWIGLIDEVMIFDRALSEVEIHNIYNTQKPGATPARISQADDLSDEKLKNLASILSSIQSAVQEILEKIKDLF